MIEWIGGWLVLKTLGAAPTALAGPLAAALFQILYWLTPKLRHVADQNLRMAFPELDPAARKKICRGVYRSLARMLVACSHFPSLRREKIHHAVSFEGLEHYEAALARGRGVIFLTAHLGAWELGAFAHGLKGYRLHVVHRALDNPRLHRLVNHYRSLGGNSLIEKRESARSVLAALARNETVGILADQNTLPEEGVFVRFFGIPASMTAGVARIALHNRAAVVPAFCVWDSRQRRFRIFYEPALELNVTGDAEQDVLSATQQMAEVIERFVRRYPDQWLWIHRRWKTRPPGEPALYS